MRERDIAFLERFIAPVMRAQQQVNPKSMMFEIDVLRLSTARMQDNTELFDALRARCMEAVSELPLSISEVSSQEDLITSAMNPIFWEEVDEGGLDEIIEKLAPIIRYREPANTPLLELDLLDLVGVRTWMIMDGRPIPKSAFQELVKELVNSQLEQCEALAKVKAGDDISEPDIQAILDLFESHEQDVSLESLREAWGAKRASLEELLRHILRDEEIPDWGAKVQDTYAAFIAEHTTWNSRQIRMLKALTQFIIDNAKVERANLVREPFTQIDSRGFPGVFDAQEIDQIMEFTEELTA